MPYGCGRTFCEHCGEEMIHRDNRKAYESASAFGQIISRQGPAELACMDVDLSCLKILPARQSLVRMIEQKNHRQALKPMQARHLRVYDQMFVHCIACPGAADIGLHEDSGVFIIRGDIAGETIERRKVDFKERPLVTRLNGTSALTPVIRRDLFDWMNGGPNWSSRDDKWGPENGRGGKGRAPSRTGAS